MLRFFLFFFTLSNIALASELNLFTSRHYQSDIQLFKKFTDQTGIKVNVISGKSKVLEKRILEEGNKSIADILFLADAGSLYSAENKGLFTKLNSEIVDRKVPSSLRNNFWVGITKEQEYYFITQDFYHMKKSKTFLMKIYQTKNGKVQLRLDKLIIFIINH